MTTTRQNRTKRIATRMVEGGYRVTGQSKTYTTYAAAFNAAWRACARTGADLYAITPKGDWVFIQNAKAIQAYERERRAAKSAAK